MSAIPKNLHRSSHGGPSPTVASSTSIKRRSNKLMLQARELEQALIHLRDRFPQPEFDDVLRAAIEQVRAFHARDVRHVRDDVLHAICVQGCTTKREIIEDTRLPEKVVRRVLAELVQHGLVIEREEEEWRRELDERDGSPRKMYWPVHTHVLP